MSDDKSDCSCERFSTVSFWRVDDPTCPYHHPPTQIWHDETERWQRTGHLDQGPCWCADCIPNDDDRRTR